MSESVEQNRGTPTELLLAGKQIALKKDAWSDFSVEQIVQKILDLFGLDIPNWQEIIANFDELRRAIEGTYTGNDMALNAIQSVIGTIRKFATGLIDPSRLPLIPFSHIGESFPNLLENGGFDGAESLDGQGIWTWDGAEGHTKPGSARATGDGTRKVLLSNSVAATPGQKFDFSGWVKWSGVSGGMGSFRVSAVAYSGNAGVETKTVANIDSPVATKTWTEMTGTYEVPTGADNVRVQVEIGASVTAGTIWWDDMKVSKYGTVPQQWVTGLVDDLGALGSWIKDLIERLTGQVWSTIGDALGGLSTWTTQLGTILSGGTVSTPLPSLVGATISTIRRMIEQITGIAKGDPVTPINGFVQDFKDGWATAAADAKSLTEQVADNINAAVSGGVASGVDAIRDVFDTVADLFGLAGIAREIAMSAQTQLQEITNGGDTPAGFEGYTWSTIFAGADGASLPSGDWPVVSGLVIRGAQGHVGIADGQANGHWHARAAGEFLSDTQSASAVLGPRGKYGQDWDTGLYVRCDDAMTVGAYARVRSNRIDIGRFSRSGTAWTHTQFTQIATAIREGDLIRFRATGDTYHVLVNGIVRASFTDGSASVAKGASYRRAGFTEQRNEYYAFPFTYRDDSHRVAAFAMADWAPPGATVTSPGWRLRRGSGNEVALSVAHGAQAPMPTGFYNVSDLEAQVTVSDLGTGQVTIESAGWYEIAATGTHRDNEAHTTGRPNSSDIRSFAHVENAWHASPWVLYVDGAAIAGPIMAGVAATVYLDVGQVVRPGVSASTPIMPGSTGADASSFHSMQARSRITGVSGAPSASFTGRKVG